LGIEEKEDFLDGYAIPTKEFQKMSGTIKLLNILHYGPIVERAVKTKDRPALARFEQRLNGAFDLFCP